MDLRKLCNELDGWTTELYWRQESKANRDPATRELLESGERVCVRIIATLRRAGIYVDHHADNIRAGDYWLSRRVSETRRLYAAVMGLVEDEALRAELTELFARALHWFDPTAARETRRPALTVLAGGDPSGGG